MPFILFSQGKLEKAKESLSNKKPTINNSLDSYDDNSTKRRVRRNRDNNGFFAPIIEDIVFYAFYGALIGNSEYRQLTPYPYYNNSKGEYLLANNNPSKNSNFKIGVNQLFNSDINALELNANYRFIPILGIEVSHLNFSERSIQGKAYLDVTSFMLNYYRIREQSISLWWGMGASYVGNKIDTWGFTYNIGTEIFPFKPVSLYTNYKQSFINANNINQFKFQVKYHIKNVALYTGYHTNELGSENVSGLILGAAYTF